MRLTIGRASSIVGLCLGLVGCGGGSSPTSPSATPSAAPVSQVLMEGAVSDMTPKVLLVIGNFATTTIGNLEVTVNWTFATNNVDVYVTRGACTAEGLTAGTCTVAFYSESTTAKPEKVYVTGLNVGTYSLLIGNRGPETDSGSYQVVHTH